MAPFKIKNFYILKFFIPKDFLKLIFLENMENKEDKIKKIVYSLTQQERKILPFLLENKSIEEIKEATNLEEEAIKRALEFLENKKLVKLNFETKKIVDLDENGIIYLKNFLPERKLANLLIEKNEIPLADIKIDDETKVSLGELKKMKIINIEEGKIKLIDKEKAIKKFPQEKFLESLPKEEKDLSNEEKEILKNLLNRKKIIKIYSKTEFIYEPLEILKDVQNFLETSKIVLIDKVTPELIKNKGWKGKKFRYYDIISKVPEVYYGKRQFYLNFLDYIRYKLLNYGFKEMISSIIVNEFWNFDVLFQPQFHIAREWSDTYIIQTNDTFQIDIPNDLMKRVKKMHEEKWKYKWNEEKAKTLILRPQGTVISALTLAKNAKKIKEFLEKTKNIDSCVFEKYFAIVRVFRPDVVDQTHLTEFTQCEGIIIGKNLSFPNLLGWLKNLAEDITKAKEIKFKPDYYPFTEPSVEMSIKLKDKWLEVGGAGIFREELIKPLFGEYYDNKIKVLAWGLGVDRLAMIKFGIDDIRDIFTKDLYLLRNKQIY